MLNGITWTEFLTAIAVVAAGWYGYVLLAYYRKELMRLGSNKRRDDTGVKDDPEPDESLDDDGANNRFAELEMIVNQLRFGVLEQTPEDADKTLVLTQLQEIISGYGGIRIPAFRMAINNFVITKAKERGLDYTTEELDEAWGIFPDEQDEER